MTANLVLIMTTAGDKSENESGISLEKIESDKLHTYDLILLSFGGRVLHCMSSENSSFTYKKHKICMSV